MARGYQTPFRGGSLSGSVSLGKAPSPLEADNDIGEPVRQQLAEEAGAGPDSDGQQR